MGAVSSELAVVDGEVECTDVALFDKIAGLVLGVESVWDVEWFVGSRMDLCFLGSTVLGSLVDDIFKLKSQSQ